jgi:hypothetical protein
MGGHIIRHGFEAFQKLLRLINDTIVFQNSAVVRNVNSGGLGGVLSVDALSLGMPFTESLEGRDGLCNGVD